MSDGLKKFFEREIDELKRNKIRTIALIVCAVVLLIFGAIDDSGGEEISLNEPAKVDNHAAKVDNPSAKTETPVTKDLPVKTLPVTKNFNGVTIVAGADADDLIVADPFAVTKKIKQPPPMKQPPIQIPIQPQIPKETKKFFLTGTAISGNVKTAMFLREKETLFLTIGDEINGKVIVNITPDFVTFADGERVFVQRGEN